MTVFVSYAREDLQLVRRLAAALGDHTWDVWVDLEGIVPSAPWWDEIRSAIAQSDAFVAVISPDYLDSAVCAHELEHAVSLSKRLVPVLVRPVLPEHVPPALAELNWISLGDGDSFVEDVDRLDEVLRTDLDLVRLHTRLLVRALQWEAAAATPACWCGVAS